MLEYFISALKQSKEKFLYRSLKESNTHDFTEITRGEKKFISFCCNDYLGLSHHESVKSAAIAAIKKYGVGARASRYVTGNNFLYAQLEKQIAQFKKTDDSIVFTSGYAAAIGVIPTLVGKEDLIIADRLIHSSLIDGSKLSEARLMRFQHNDIAHCRKILSENRTKFRHCLIITETVFSMDGDVGKVTELLQLATESNCFLISDAAHDLWLGNQNFSASNHLQMGTLSKSVGSLGGYIAGDKNLIDYLRNFSKSVIYSTALPPSILAASSASLEIISQEKIGEKTLTNARYFCQLMELPEPESAIVVMIIGNNAKVLEIAQKMEEKGFLISAIRPPTVEPGKARLRITFSAKHEKQEIEELVKALKSVL